MHSFPQESPHEAILTSICHWSHMMFFHHLPYFSELSCYAHLLLWIQFSFNNFISKSIEKIKVVIERICVLGYCFSSLFYFLRIPSFLLHLLLNSIDFLSLTFFCYMSRFMKRKKLDIFRRNKEYPLGSSKFSLLISKIKLNSCKWPFLWLIYLLLVLLFVFVCFLNNHTTCAFSFRYFWSYLILFCDCIWIIALFWVLHEDTLLF